MRANLELRRFREANHLSVRECAELFRIKHPTWIAWESGEATPMSGYRRALEIWTHGRVRASGWPISSREREAEKAARVIAPFVPTMG